MSGIVELTDGIPPAATDPDDADDVYIYGADLERPSPAAPAGGGQRVLTYGFCYQGHCYRLSMPVEFKFNTGLANIATGSLGCGYDSQPGYRRWKVEKTDKATRIERRKSSVEELLLDFNLPGRSPATLTYSAKVAIASKAGKVYE